ncbi:MAG: EAL domain-containing protein [Gammaproteobacteria bacterium]|jgi:EAL domain-containing protein (putative c-di-GMP-specific phosphodiesterase class I)
MTSTLTGTASSVAWKLQTIAEGVETEAQLEFLRRQGRDGFQGYLFSEPVAETPFLALASRGSGY